MARRIKPSNCRFRSKARGEHGADNGMVLIVIMIVATLLLIGLAATLPSVYQEGRREREAELIFRGSQYARAVALFHKQFNRYPIDTKELLQTNGMRFLRQEYRDPMDPKGKWRFIHVNAAGVLLDSKNQPLNGNCNQNPAGLGQSGSMSSMATGGSGFSNSSPGISTMGMNSPGCSSTSNSGIGNSSSSSSSFGNSSFGGSSFGSSPMGNSSSFGSQGMGNSMGSNNFGGGSSQSGPSSSFFGNSNDVQGAFIAGVAATSDHEAIRVWQKHHHYDEWEFIGLDLGAFGMQVGMPGGGSGMPGMGQQNQNQSGGGFMQNPSQGSSPSSFGPGSSTSTFGPSSN